jgi:triosephosphate isomerase (TIM)
MNGQRMLLAGNWKMNGLRSSLAELRALSRAIADEPAAHDVLLCPPATLIAEAVRAAEGSRIAIGGQDCHAEASGAFTGDISAEMLRDAGATHVIVGHSERRQYHDETDAMVAAKAAAARRAGLVPIVCVGEAEAERNAGKAARVVGRQLDTSLPTDLAGGDYAIAYEPVWAIGTGKTPTAEQIAEMHRMIHEKLTRRGGPGVRILYGGSVKPANAAEILGVEHVDGVLVGGASLKAGDFLAIIRAAPNGKNG